MERRAARYLLVFLAVLVLVEGRRLAAVEKPAARTLLEKEDVPDREPTASTLTSVIPDEGGDADAADLPPQLLLAFDFLTSPAFSPMPNATATCDARLAARLPGVVAESLDFYSLGGYCSLPTAEEQYSRLTTTLQYGLSTEVRAMLANQADAAASGATSSSQGDVIEQDGAAGGQAGAVGLAVGPDGYPPEQCTSGLREAVEEAVLLLQLEQGGGALCGRAAGDDEDADQAWQQQVAAAGILG